MTILDKLFGGDDPPKKKYIAPVSTIVDTVDDLGYKGMLGLIQKAASNPNAYSEPIRNVPYYSETEGPMMIREGSRSKEGLPPGMMIRKIEGEKGNKYYLRMKDNPPMPVSEYLNPELFQFLESNNPDKAEMIRLIQGILGGTSNTPGGSPYGFANGVDGGGLHDYSFKKVNADMNIGPIEIPRYEGTLKPFKENEPFEPYYPTMRPYNVTIRPPLVRPFELKEFDDGITIRKRRSLFDMISNFPFLGTEPVKGIKGI